jgi:hypothetical protein
MWIFMPSEYLISLGFKYLSCIGHAHMQCSCVVLVPSDLALSDLVWTDLSGSSHHMSYHCLQLSSFKNMTSCSPETELLKQQSQMGALLV